MRKLPALLLFLLVVSPAFAQEKIELRLHFIKGDVHSMTVILDQTIDQTVGGKPERLTQRLTTGYTLKVEDVDERGQATVSLRYDSQGYHAAANSVITEYDSTQPGSVEPAVAATLGALIGQGYSFTVSPEGQITHVTGLEKLGNVVANKLSAVEGPARVAADKIIRLQLSEPNVKSTLQNLFAPFPDHPVAPGESWARSTTMNQGFSLALDTTCTLKTRDSGIATLEITGHYSTPAGSTMELGQTKFTYDFQGDTHTQIQIQESTGWTQSVTSTQSLAGNTTTQSPVAAQSIPLKMESTLKATAKTAGN